MATPLSHRHLKAREVTFAFVQGTLAPKQKKEILIHFKTDEAKVIVSTIVIKVGEGTNELSRVLKVSAVGKYPYILLDS